MPILTRFISPIILLCILAATMACYWPGLTGYFNFDDRINIAKNAGLQIDGLDASSLSQAASSGHAGLLKRPISMLSFALNYYASGMDPYYFKLTNLIIHLLNGMLVFVLAKLLLNLYARVHRTSMDDASNIWIASAVAAIWLLHPFNLTGVLYVVQRMTSLAALFMLGGLALYLYGRKLLLDGRRSGFFAIVIALFVATPLAALSKENGVLLPLLIFVTEITLLRWNTAELGTRRALLAIVALSAIVPALLGALYVLNNQSQILGAYVTRDFSLTERLMTEARVIWFYLHMIVLPSMSEMGLHHDDILISRSLFLPWTTLPAIAGLLLLAGGVFALRNKQPLLAFGVAFFFAGHALESTIIPLEIAFEHRNYFPMFGILLPLTYYALNSQLHLSTALLRRAAFVLLLIMFAALTAARAQQWGNVLGMRMLEVERHPLSVRANTDLADLYDHLPATSPEDAINLYNKAIFHYQQAADAAPANTAGLFGVLVVNAERGLHADHKLIDTLEQRLATVPMGTPNVNSLVGTVRCVVSGDCRVAPKVIERLYRAALSNPTLAPAHRNWIVAEFDRLPPDTRPKTESPQYKE